MRVALIDVAIRCAIAVGATIPARLCPIVRASLFPPLSLALEQQTTHVSLPYTPTSTSTSTYCPFFLPILAYPATILSFALAQEEALAPACVLLCLTRCSCYTALQRAYIFKTGPRTITGVSVAIQAIPNYSAYPS